MESSGAFGVALHALAWRSVRAAVDDEGADALQPQPTTLWAHVEVESALDGVWFGADDENVMTKSVELARDAEDEEWQLEYAQSSRPVPLTKDSLVALLHAQLKVSLFSGTTRAAATDALWGEARVALMPAVIGERLHERVRITNSTAGEEVTVELSVQCDADLADFALGARVLRLHAVTISCLPQDWTIACESDDEALRLCEATDRNPPLYELEMSLPDFVGDSAETTRETIKFTGGKLKYEPDPNASLSNSSAAEGAAAAAPPSGPTGVWSIVFPTGAVHKLYLKPVVHRLVDFLHVEKTTVALLRRSSTDAAGRVTATIPVNLSAIAAPGTTRLHVDVPLKKMAPLPKEALEQELAGAASNDEKKRLQALVNDYDAAIVQVVAALSGSVRAAKTRLECVVDVLGNGPLVPEPPPTLAPTQTIGELIALRDLGDEYDARKDVVADLRTEIRRVVLTVLREYEDADATAPRDDKRQRIVFQLNSQGAYHEFKEKLKKRIVPLIRDQFADHEDDGDADEHGDADDDGDDENGNGVLGGERHGDAAPTKQETRANARKKTYFARVYAALMDEVQRVLHEAFYASAAASPLEKTHRDLQARDDAKVTLALTTLGLQALENEVNGDAEKSEALHRDRIAFAEARAVELPQVAAAMRPTLGRVWLDYARFCLGQGELDRAGAALRQCLALEPHAVEALIAYGGLLCELQDFTSADTVVKNAVSDALKQAAAAASEENGSSDGDDALRHVVTCHALLALLFAQSRQDETGNLVLFELLKAKRALHRLNERQQQQQQQYGAAATTTTSTGGAEPSLSAVWIHLAHSLHVLRLRGVTQAALALADEFHRPRDVLSCEERVLARAVLAEVLSLRGEGERATALLQEALEIDRSHAFAWLVLGKTYLQVESQTPAAITCLQHALASKHRLRADQRLSLYAHLGLVQLQSSQFAAAKATFLSACAEFALASTWLGVGIASLRLEDWDGAQLALAEANRLDATNAEVWGYLALLALSAPPCVTAQHEQRAKRSVTQALRFQLSNPALLRELSSGFVAIDRLEDAERLLRRSLVFQDSSLTRKTLADVLAAQNCAEDALAQYKQSLDECRDAAARAELLDKCAVLLVTLGRPDDASECRQMASALLLPVEAAEGNSAENDSAASST